MIEFRNVTKYYKSNVGLDNVTVKINKGDFVFLVGPSGAGKSTFIKLILKELEADKGTIMVRGENVTKMSARQVPGLRRNIGIVFQDFRLLPKKTVYENVAFAMEIIHQPRKLIRKHVPQVLSMMGILDKATKYPDELSAGEQQRVAIARAIVNKPRILIADEPTGNLDPDTSWEIMQLLNMINMRGTTILMVTHAKDIVDKMEKRVIAIENGRIVRDEFGMYGYKQALMGDDSAFDESAVKEGRSRRFTRGSHSTRGRRSDTKGASRRTRISSDAVSQDAASTPASASAQKQARRGSNTPEFTRVGDYNTPESTRAGNYNKPEYRKIGRSEDTGAERFTRISGTTASYQQRQRRAEDFTRVSGDLGIPADSNPVRPADGNPVRPADGNPARQAGNPGRTAGASSVPEWARSEKAAPEKTRFRRGGQE